MVLQVLLAHLRLDFRAFFSVSANDLRVFKSAENCIYKQGREQLDVMLTRSDLLDLLLVLLLLEAHMIIVYNKDY